MTDSSRAPSLVRRESRHIGVLEIGPLGFGCWRLVGMSPSEVRARLETALDAGFDLVDTADVYGLDWGGAGFGDSEALLGKALAEAPALRERMVLATKGGIQPGIPYDSSANGLERACEASLQRLGLDSVDLYQVHRPDLFAHPEEVATALTKLRESGRTREVGVSNYTPSQVETLAALLPFPLATSQPELSAARLEPLRDGSLDLCMRLGITPLAWSPLAGGRLVSGEGVRPELLGVLDSLAQREGVERSVIALAFLLAHPSAPVPILGTTRPERIREATRALDVHLERTDVYRIVEASEGVALP